MSEFLAEASVLIRPDTTAFRTALETQLLTATRGVSLTIPVALTGSGIGAAAGATSTLVAAQKAAQESTLGLASAANVEASAFGRQAVILGTVTTSTEGLAAAQVLEANAAREAGAAHALATTSTLSHVAANEQLRKGLLASTLAQLGARGATLAASQDFLLGAAAVTVFAKSVQNAANLQTELNVFREVAKATGDQLKEVSNTAKQLGADITLPAVSASDAAEAMTELAKAGLSVQDSIAGARGVLQLATAAQIDNAQATNITASALNAFGLSGRDALRVADLLANASNEAQGSIADMGAALTQAAAVSRQVGISLTDTVALLTLLAKNGIQGANAGTVLRVALLRLVAPSVAAQKIIDKLGISIRDAQGNIRPDVFAQFAKATESLTNAQRDADAAIVFGTRGIRAQAILGREGAASLSEMAIAVDQAGAAQALAGARTEGFAGSVEALKNTLETLSVSLGSLTLGPLQTFIDTENEAIGTTSTFVSAIKDLASAGAEPIDLIVKITGGEEGTTKRIFDKIRGEAQFAGAAPGILPIKIVLEGVGVVEDQLSGVRSDATGVANDIAKILAQLKATGGGPTALNEASLALQKIVDRLEKGSPAAQQLAREVQKVIDQLREGSNIPPFQFPDIKIPPALLRGDLGTQVGHAQLSALDAALTGQPAFDIGRQWLEDIAAGAQAAAPKVGADVAETLNVSLSTKLSVAEATGTQGDVLSILEERRAKLIARLNALQDQPQTQLVQKKVQQTADLLTTTQGRIKSILAQQQSTADKIASDIVTATSKSDQAIIDAISGGEQKRRNALLKATATEGLGDDITRQKVLRAFFANKIKEVRKTVQDAVTKAQEIASLTSKFIQATNDIAALEKQQRDALRSQRQAALDQRLEILGLNEQAAAVSGNKSRQEKILNAEIAELERQIRGTKKGSLKRAQLNLALRQAQKDLADLTTEAKKTNAAQKSLTFEFLQRQQGFAANLLGNLIPGGATAGLVGGGAGSVSTLQGPTSPAQGVQSAAAISGSRDNPLTRGDVQTELHLLRSILNELRDGNSKGDHPEAWFNRRVSGAAMDTMGV